MSLSSLYLEAFVGVAKAASFSTAAKELGITQSALSQRVKNLEKDLGLTLFLRTTNGVQLTEQGLKVLRYCQTKETLEDELLHDLSAEKMNELSGVIRIGAYSSILRSAVIPSLAGLLNRYPNILCEFQSRQMHELPTLLNRGEVDFIIMDYTFEKANLERCHLGQEELVVIENTQRSNRNHLFLDNNYNDKTTEDFFRVQKTSPPEYQRSYCDDCYGIIEGVEQGLGRAVMSSHLVKKNKRLKIVKKYKPVYLDVNLYYHSQPFYSSLHKAIIHELTHQFSL